MYAMLASVKCVKLAHCLSTSRPDSEVKMEKTTNWSVTIESGLIVICDLSRRAGLELYI